MSNRLYRYRYTTTLEVVVTVIGEDSECGEEDAYEIAAERVKEYAESLPWPRDVTVDAEFDGVSGTLLGDDE